MNVKVTAILGLLSLSYTSTSLAENNISNPGTCKLKGVLFDGHASFRLECEDKSIPETTLGLYPQASEAKRLLFAQAGAALFAYGIAVTNVLSAPPFLAGVGGLLTPLTFRGVIQDDWLAYEHALLFGVSEAVVEITPAQAKTIYNHVEKAIEACESPSGCHYSLTTHNCVDFVQSIFALAGHHPHFFSQLEKFEWDLGSSYAYMRFIQKRIASLFGR